MNLSFIQLWSFLLALGVALTSTRSYGEEMPEGYLREAALVREDDRRVEVDISNLALRYFPIGGDASLIKERLRSNGLEIWKRNVDHGRAFIGASYRRKSGALGFDEYRVLVDLDEYGKAKSVKAWIFFHSL